MAGRASAARTDAAGTSGDERMQVPVGIAFRNCSPTEEMRAEVDKCVQRLEKFSDRLTSCHVLIQAPETRHRHGDAYRVMLRIAMPRHTDIVVDRSPTDEGENGYPLVAIRNAFAAAVRQIEDAARKARGDVKEHLPGDHGRIARFIAGDDYGFIEASDGQEIYFHRNAVPNGAFDRLKVGDEVRFVASDGEKGLQASTVHPSGNHNPS